jgi:hypothetical protein
MMMNGVTVLLLKNKVEILEKLVNNYRYMNERKTAAPAQLFVCALFLYKKEEKKKIALERKYFLLESSPSEGQALDSRVSAFVFQVQTGSPGRALQERPK